MPLVTFKALCLDTRDEPAAIEFWGPVLGLSPVTLASGEVVLAGPTPQHDVWPCEVPEPKSVKNRVHLDVSAATSVLPGTTALSEEGEFPWRVLAGPEGDELCTFVVDPLPEYRLREVGVDCVDHRAVSAWWAGVWGGTVGVDDDEDFSWVADIPGVPFDGFAFQDVPEPKTVKNRVHWDVTLEPGVGVADLVAAGATVLRPVDDDISWTVMVDPEGNEFCVFASEDDA